MAQQPPRKSIFSLEGLGSALGGVFFEDPPSDESEEGTPPPNKSPVFVPPPPSASGGGETSPGSSSSSNSSSGGGGGDGSRSSDSSDGNRGSSNSESSSSSSSNGSSASSAEQGTPGKGYLGTLLGAGGAVGYVVPTFGLMSPKKSWAMPQKTRMPRQRGERPVAGRTCADFLRAGPTSEYHTWYTVEANTFSLRVGPNYEKNKSKGPSPDALYDLVGLE